MPRLLLSLILALGLVQPALGQAERPDLIGSITTRDGKPVPRATVRVWTAGVKTGYSTYCPSCYEDCSKHARTADDGSFRIESLDPDLVFRILVVAEGFQPAFVPKVDPAAGPMTAALERRELPPPDSGRVLHGRVVDEHGNPVENAVVSPDSVMFDDRTGRGGAVEGLDPLAVTNSDGAFALCYKDRFATMDLEAEASGFAKVQAERLAPGPTVHTIALRRGATITGRLTKDGKPVPGVLIGAAQINRIGGFYLGEHTIGTDDQGRFRLDNVPVAKPGMGYGTGMESPRVWAVYAKMESVRTLGATATGKVTVDKDGDTHDVGDLELLPGHTLSGRVILDDGKPVAEGTRVVVARDGAWDSQHVTTDDQGRFRAVNLPTDRYQVFASVKGYRAAGQAEYTLGPAMMIDRDLTDFVLRLEPSLSP